MRSRLWSLLVILGLFELSKSGVVCSHVVTEEPQPCRARAWVRAPDLELGQIIQGEVKVKLDGICDEVSSYTLRLRFAERSWVKTRRDGVQIPERPVANGTLDPVIDPNATVFEFDDIWMQSLSIDPLTWEKYQKEVNDPELWLALEEERIGFEIKYDLCAEKELKNDVVEPFAILVPTTVYPPSFDPLLSSSSLTPQDDAGSEHIYAYFVDVAFVNGTTREISAGYTSFNGGRKTINHAPETINVTATGTAYLTGENGMLYSAVPTDSFTLEITFPNGRYPEQGSINNMTIVSHQLGPGHARPERLEWLQVLNEQKRHWAASHAVDNVTAEILLSAGRRHSSQLRPTDPKKNDWRSHRHLLCQDVEWTFSQEGIVESGKPFSTNAMTAQFEVPKDCYPHFEMQHHTSEVKLTMSLVVRNTSLPEVSTGDDQEDYDWTPTIKETDMSRYTILWLAVPIFVRPKLEGSATIEGEHYLSPDALAPIFVPPSSVNQLLQKSPTERDTLAPNVQPTFMTHTGSDIVKQRYYQGFPSAGNYVGNTWLRKVLLRKENGGVSAQTGGFAIQV